MGFWQNNVCNSVSFWGNKYLQLIDQSFHLKSALNMSGLEPNWYIIFSSSSPSLHHIQRHEEVEAEAIGSDKPQRRGRQRRRVCRPQPGTEETRWGRGLQMCQTWKRRLASIFWMSHIICSYKIQLGQQFYRLFLFAQLKAQRPACLRWMCASRQRTGVTSSARQTTYRTWRWASWRTPATPSCGSN